MLHYMPPKSRLWGHAVGKLSAIAIVERAHAFLGEYCQIIRTCPSDLQIHWTSLNHKSLSELAQEIDGACGPATSAYECDESTEGRFYQRHWNYEAEALARVASWVDRLDSIATKHDTDTIGAQASTSWEVAWRHESAAASNASPGGTFGIVLSLPRRELMRQSMRRFALPHTVTTIFSFFDVDQFLHIKAGLTKVGLVDLSEKHLRPKSAIEPIPKLAD
jgi:hypothetical protein